jgi:hypothetical protein
MQPCGSPINRLPEQSWTGARYLHAIADAAISGARWVVAFDPDLRRGCARARPMR